MRMNEHPSNTSTFQEQMYYKRVLLIEDDNRIANFIQRGLKAEGYAVEVAVTGQEGLLLATEGRFQTIILDLGLPDIDGQKICEYLRAKRIDTPILMLTAREGIKEFALLEFFLRRRGKVLSRARILEQVWGYNADPQTNVVDVHIGQLRHKIDDDHAIKLLKTVRGFGYKLDES